MNDFLKVEINTPPQLSILWFYPKDGRYGQALIYSSEPHVVNTLQLLKDRLEGKETEIVPPWYMDKHPLGGSQK